VEALTARGWHCSRCRRTSRIAFVQHGEDTRQFSRTSALAATVKVTRRRLRALSNHFREVKHYFEMRNLENILNLREAEVSVYVLCKNVSRFRAKIHPGVLRVANYINPTGLARRDYQIKTRLDNENVKETNISRRESFKKFSLYLYHDKKKFSAPYRTEYKNAEIGKSIARANSTTNSSTSISTSTSSSKRSEEDNRTSASGKEERVSCYKMSPRNALMSGTNKKIASYITSNALCVAFDAFCIR
ncbi:hypothetical protein ALC57_11858, partial [Trachymyrmex cornetzi]